MTSSRTDALALAAAFLLAGGSAAWFVGRPLPSMAARDEHPVAASLEERHEAAVTARNDTPPGITDWLPIQTQRGGEETYGLFTSPAFDYDTALGRVVVRDRRERLVKIEKAWTENTFGLDLVRVGFAPFRLQLVGYVGHGSTALGVFEDLRSGEMHVVGAGSRFESLRLDLVSFDVHRREVVLGDGGRATLPVARAAVRDIVTGEFHELSDRERFDGPVPVATVAIAGSDETNDVHEGERLECGPAVFRIDRIELAPPSIQVTKVRGDSAESRRLEIAPGASPPAPPATPDL